MCSYPVLDMVNGSLTAPFRLKTRTVLSAGEQSEMVELLTWAPLDNLRSRACTAMGGDETVHLIGSRYPDAIVWVAAKADPNGCSQSTNGDFVSSAAVGSRLGAAFGDKSRPDPAPTGACASWGWSARRPPVDCARRGSAGHRLPQSRQRDRAADPAVRRAESRS